MGFFKKDKNEEEPEVPAEPERFVLGYEDRRRLAVAQMLLSAERNGGYLYPTDTGDAVLSYALGEAEVMPMAEAAVRDVVRRFGGGA